MIFGTAKDALFMTASVVVQLRIGPEIALASTLGYRTFHVSRKPLPRMVQMQDVFALETESRKACCHARVHIRRVFGPVRSRDAHNLEAHHATG